MSYEFFTSFSSCGMKTSRYPKLRYLGSFSSIMHYRLLMTLSLSLVLLVRFIFFGLVDLSFPLLNCLLIDEKIGNSKLLPLVALFSMLVLDTTLLLLLMLMLLNEFILDFSEVLKCMIFQF